MTSTTAPASTTESRSTDRVVRAIGPMALSAGTALVVDTVTTAAINRHFDPLDSILFLAGFAGLWLTDLALAVHLSAGRSGRSRALAALGWFVIVALAIGAVSMVSDQVGRHVFSPSNIGLHGEGSCFSAGICMVLISVWAFRRGRRLAVPAGQRDLGSRTPRSR